MKSFKSSENLSSVNLGGSPLTINLIKPNILLRDSIG